MTYTVGLGQVKSIKIYIVNKMTFNEEKAWDILYKLKIPQVLLCKNL